MDFLKNINLDKLNSNLKILNSTGRVIRGLRNIQKFLTIITLAFTAFRLFQTFKKGFN